MAHYLLQAAYTSEAWTALVNNPQDRTKGVEGAIKNLGGKIERFWLSFGDYDMVGVVEMPDTVSAAAFSHGGRGRWRLQERKDHAAVDHSGRHRSHEEGGAVWL